jgi:AcrR family transcriptional regulator
VVWITRPDKRERLVAAAAELVDRHGVETPTLAQIAQAADVPPGNVYYYFKTREDLREMSRGIHPAVLTDGGLGPAIEMLALRATVPVVLNLGPPVRFAERVEAARWRTPALPWRRGRPSRSGGPAAAPRPP